VTHLAPEPGSDGPHPRGAAPRPADAFSDALPPQGPEKPQQEMKKSDWLAGRSYFSWDRIRAHGDACRRGYERGPGSAGGARKARDWICEHCGRSFRAKPVHDHRGYGMPRRFCTGRCSNAGRRARGLARRQLPIDALLEAWGSQSRRARKPRPDAPEAVQAAELLAEALVLIRLQLPLAHDVVMGHGTWSASQARVFLDLLDKVLPRGPA
jgi:hypothetical protein